MLLKHKLQVKPRLSTAGMHGSRMLWIIVDLQRRLRCRCHGFAALGSAKGALENQVWIACVWPWFGLTDEAFGAKE